MAAVDLVHRHKADVVAVAGVSAAGIAESYKEQHRRSRHILTLAQAVAPPSSAPAPSAASAPPPDPAIVTIVKSGL
jgi:hypothetical protein